MKVNSLRLIDVLTNGSQTVISDTGTTVLYKPGTIALEATFILTVVPIELYRILLK